MECFKITNISRREEMKKTLVLIVAVIMTLTVFVGCAAPAESEAPASEAPASEAPASEAPASEAPAEDPAAPAAETKDVSEVKIGISMPTLQEERWQKDRQIVIDELIALGVPEGNIFDQSANGDEQEQVTQCENLITQGIDALIIFPQNGEVCAPVVESAHEAGVEVIAIDRIINNSDLDFFITYDAYTIGTIQGEYITNLVDEGNWIMIEGAPTDPNAALIRDGQMEYVQPLIDEGKVTVVLDQAANYWDPAEALLYTEQGLTANNNDIQCVFTSNDGCAGAAIEALEEQGLAGDVPVPGLDADLAACQRIVAGTQTMTVYRKLSIMDQYAARVAVAFATGAPVEDYVDVEIETKNNNQKDVPAILLKGEDQMFAVDATNMEEVVKDGWLTKEDIYANVPEAEWPEW